MARPYLHTEPLDKLHVRGYVVDVQNTATGKYIGNLSWGSSGFFFHARSTASRAISAARASGKLHLSSFPDPEESSRFILANVDHPTTRRDDVYNRYYELPITDILAFSIRPFHRVYYSSDSLPKDLPLSE